MCSVLPPPPTTLPWRGLPLQTSARPNAEQTWHSFLIGKQKASPVFCSSIHLTAKSLGHTLVTASATVFEEYFETSATFAAYEPLRVRRRRDRAEGLASCSWGSLSLSWILGCHPVPWLRARGIQRTTVLPAGVCAGLGPVGPLQAKHRAHPFLQMLRL